MSFFKRFFGSTRDNDPVAWSLYEAAVAQARQPAFYGDRGVPDTLDGRFELISLHVSLILRRLRLDTGDSGPLGQNLFDAMFSDMDRSLREMGAGDLGVAPRVKKMAKAFYGRLAAYDAGLLPEAGVEDLAEAVRRNIYGTVADPDSDNVAALVNYIRREDDSLATQPSKGVFNGEVSFGPAPTRGSL
jgi:cytochrome b pre-mRNA-processing protein 3